MRAVGLSEGVEVASVRFSVYEIRDLGCMCAMACRWKGPAVVARRASISVIYTNPDVSATWSEMRIRLL